MARADHYTAHQPITFALSDGTQVALDADSAIAVSFDGQVRNVKMLRGRAWFDVAQGTAPFVIKALDGKIRDIGTRFEVAIDGGAVSASVAQGIVDVSTDADGTHFVRLYAGQMAHYQRDGQLSAPMPADVNAIAAWRNGEILFQWVAPKKAIEQIERYYDGAIWVVGDINKGQTISGLFSASAPRQAIDVIASQLGLKVRHLLGGVLLIYAS